MNVRNNESAVNFWGFSVDDIGLDGYSTEEHLNNILNFLDEYQIKATFFAVPEVEGKKIALAAVMCQF